MNTIFGKLDTLKNYITDCLCIKFFCCFNMSKIIMENRVL